VRGCEGLVQVKVDHIKAHVTRAGDAHNRIGVGAVIVQKAAGLVDKTGYFLNALLKQAKGTRVGQHQGGYVTVILLKDGLEGLDVNVARFIGLDLNGLVSGHNC